ncbi:MAG: FhaA domain-containing protein [Actinomycetota bacterium]
MGILNDFERRLEGLIEGVFTKAFRTGVHPVELANRIIREMDANKTVGVRQVWVPNRFTFTLSGADYERFEQTEKALRRELEQVVTEGAAERGWGLVGPAEVVFVTDEGIKQGEYRCEASLVEGPTTGQPAVTPEARREQRASADGAELVLIERGKAGRAFPLRKDRVSIGRLEESDIALSDPGVSRRHAEVQRRDGDFVVVDLGSTNGTMVNEAAISERTLQPGDRITIGRSVLEFRRA